MTTGDLIPFVLVASLFCGLARAGILYPRESESREVKSLDGIWNFKLPITDRDAIQAFNEKWFLRELKDSGPTIPMPVPSSYNDLTQLKEIRDYVGVVWYDRTFFVPTSWSENQRVWLRFGSVCYAAQVVSSRTWSVYGSSDTKNKSSLKIFKRFLLLIFSCVAVVEWTPCNEP